MNEARPHRTGVTARPRAPTVPRPTAMTHLDLEAQRPLSTVLAPALGPSAHTSGLARSPGSASTFWNVQNLADQAISGRRWVVLALLEAGVPVTLLADLFAAHGPDSAHIYRHEPADAEPGAPAKDSCELAGAVDRTGS